MATPSFVGTGVFADVSEGILVIVEKVGDIARTGPIDEKSGEIGIEHLFESFPGCSSEVDGPAGTTMGGSTVVEAHVESSTSLNGIKYSLVEVWNDWDVSGKRFS